MPGMSRSRAASARAWRITRPRFCRQESGIRKRGGCFTTLVYLSAKFRWPFFPQDLFMTRAFAVLASLLFLFSGNALAQKFEPQVGQAGKDVIWVPTPDEVVDRMLTMAQVGPNDIHFDLGAGDGKIAIAAAKRGAVATGIEYNADMAKYANERAQAAGVAGVGPGK